LTILDNTDLAGIKVNDPDIIWTLEVFLVEEETGGDPDDVGCGRQQQLQHVMSAYTLAEISDV